MSKFDQAMREVRYKLLKAEQAQNEDINERRNNLLLCRNTLREKNKEIDNLNERIRQLKSISLSKSWEFRDHLFMVSFAANFGFILYILLAL